MSYTLNWSDDSLKPPFILNNETVDKQTTSLDLTGKDLSVWGEYIQEDLLRLLENFASRGIPPRAPTIGQFWYDANSDKLYLWDGVSWKTVFTAINTPIWITPKKLTSTSNVNIQLEAKYATEYKTLNLPSALNGSGNGVVSGTLIPGVYTFNSNAIAQGVSVPKQFELTIKNTPKLPVWITPAKITIATMPLSIQFEASDTIKYVLTGGVMPYGTSFTESGLLSGDCVNDLYNFTITAIGEEGSVEKTFELLVNAPVTTTTTTTTAEPSSTSTSTSLQPSNFVWYKPLNGDYTIRDDQFFDGDTYTLNVPLNNTDPYKGAISAGTEGMESLYILSGILPPGITSDNMQIMTLVGSPTTEGTYTFVVRGKGYENHVNSRGENIINVTFTYVVSISSSTSSPAVISIDYPSSVVVDDPFTWTIINGANDVNFYATGTTWNGGRTPGSGTLPTITSSTFTKSNNGINTYHTPITGFIPTPGTHNFTFYFSNGQTISKTVTATRASSTSTSSSSSTTTTTVAPVTYNPIIRFVPSTLQIDRNTDISYQIEVIGMKPNGYFHFDLGDFVNGTKWGNNGWYIPSRFKTKYGVDLNNIQADANGHWSMTLTIYSDGDAPKGYMRINDFGSHESNVNIIPNDVFMYVNSNPSDVYEPA